jgi:hypothetical protein
VVSNSDANLCLCGDFNSVRSIEERRGRGSSFRQHDSDIFNKFIDEGSLVDMPICGRVFTWYRGDGFSMSRLDRFLLSINWCNVWPNCIQMANQRGLSDHVPMILYVSEDNWGPRPFRMLKCWTDLPGYEQFVTEKWRSFNIKGWGAYVLKEKLKLIKGSLREWHQRHSQNMDGRCRMVKEPMALLDIKGESSALEDDEVAELHDLSVNLHSLSKIQTSICWQQSRLRWLQEGDANTKFFNGIMSSRRRRNAIQMLQVNGAQIEGVQNIRAAVFNHFSSHFRHIEVEQPRVDNLCFRQLYMNESGNIIRPFTLEEVKQVIWDCDSYKSPGQMVSVSGFSSNFGMW